ncbi:MAG: DUF4301 domain-containing protein [Desulfuromonas sp.]|nr:MAG: DUF4301 domain-containing protein [Desulfuromonas sp.]
MKTPTLNSKDRRQLDSLGIPLDSALQQLAQLGKGQAWVPLDRPCTEGDGIVRIAPQRWEELKNTFNEAVSRERISRFIPASGAATRMFQPLTIARQQLGDSRIPWPEGEAGEPPAGLVRFLDQLHHFPFYDDLERTVAVDGSNLTELVAGRDVATLLRYLLDPCGLGYSQQPKALLPFHRETDGTRTAFVEHLAEAALLNGCRGEVRLHFTVSPEHLDLFRAQAAAWRKRLTETYCCQFIIGYSTQKSSTDTLALDGAGDVLRNEDGCLLLRPGGHGALLDNLAELDGDIVVIRNIDNVVPDCRKQLNLDWSRRLAGLLLELQQEQHALLRELNRHGDDPLLRDLALAFLYDQMQVEIPLDLNLAGLIDQLDRPLRVCGMVENSGEPGGGPFWVRDGCGLKRRQIVEASQIDMRDADQVQILAASTHFNPVDMVCALRDWRGRPYDLKRYIDPDAVIIASKFQQEEEIRILELPGLWNGGMAGWLTQFVEIPAAAFNPVKTLFDLLRPAHQP